MDILVKWKKTAIESEEHRTMGTGRDEAFNIDAAEF